MLEKRAILRFQGYFEVTLGINGVQFLNSVKIKDKFRVLSLRRHQKISAFRPRKYLICARKTGEIVVDTLKRYKSQVEFVGYGLVSGCLHVHRNLHFYPLQLNRRSTASGQTQSER